MITYKLKASLTLAYIKKSAIGITVNNSGVNESKKALLSKKNIAVYLQFAKDYGDKPEGYWKKYRIPSMKHGDGNKAHPL